MTRQQPLDLSALYIRYGGMVRRRIRRFYGPEDADDVLQEVFLRAATKAHTFRGDAAPSTWLYQLTTRYCLGRLRDEGRRRELWIEHGDLFWGQPTAPPGQEGRTLLAQVWRQLPEELVMIGIHYHVDGMTHGEIARRLGCSRRTVGNRLVELETAARRLAGVRDERGTR